MADVRSLLRSELASRNQSTTKAPSSKKRKAGHDGPSTSRTKKPRSVSSNQILAASRRQQQAPTVAIQPKRHSQHVASPPDLDTVQEEDPTTQAEAITDAPVPLDDVSTIAETADLDADPAAALPTSAPNPIDINEDEWAAFEADISATSHEVQDARSIFNAPAAISAAPMSAEEIAAQAREKQSSQRGRREVEAEEEKEERDVKMMEEFEELEGLEERVRRLRKRREALRGARDVQGGGARAIEAAADEGGEAGVGLADDEVGEDSSDEDDEVDFWAGR